MNGTGVIRFLLLMGAMLIGAVAHAQEDAYGLFNRFCAKHFGAEKEPEMYRAFGKELKVLDDGRWMHVSETSACIAWETNLPAKTFMEYGPTGEYGQKTAESERPFFLHVRYLCELKPETTYHYRLVSTDERGNRVNGKDQTFRTKRIPDVVRIPDDLAGPPFKIDKPGTYLVTKDITAPATAFNILANGVTLDLGGHTVVYDDVAGAVDPGCEERLFGWYAAQGPCGLRTRDHAGELKILNGTIRQGRGNGTSKPAAYNPIFLRRPTATEIAGVTLDYAGSQVTGMVVDGAGEGIDVHHNVVLDRGTELFNRHRGLDGIAFNVTRVEKMQRCHHNLIKRTRQRGMRTNDNTELDHNEIYVDSFATNSYGIMYYSRGSKRLKLHDNRIFGTGFHPVGIGSGQRWSDVEITGNYIQMEGTKREERWTGGQGGGGEGTVGPRGFHPVNGIRLQRPDRNVVHANNVIVVKGSGEGCMMRGIWLVPDEKTGEGIVLRNNRIKVIAEDDKATGFAVAFGGMNAEKNPVILEGNVIISNLTNLQFNDNYSHGGKFLLRKNTLIKEGDDPRYRTIRMGWGGYIYESTGQTLVDTVVESGASLDSVSFDGAQRTPFDFSVAWTLTLRAPSGTEVDIRDSDGAQVYTGKAPADGTIAVPLVQYVCTREGRSAKTPHEITLTRDGRTMKKTIRMEAPCEVKIEKIE